MYTALWLAASTEGAGPVAVSRTRPLQPSVRALEQRRAAVREPSLRVRSRAESGRHDDQHQVQEPHPGENRWVYSLCLRVSASPRAVIASCLCPGRRSASLHLRRLRIHPALANRGQRGGKKQPPSLAFAWIIRARRCARFPECRVSSVLDFPVLVRQ